MLKSVAILWAGWEAVVDQNWPAAHQLKQKL